MSIARLGWQRRGDDPADRMAPLDHVLWKLGPRQTIGARVEALLVVPLAPPGIDRGKLIVLGRPRHHAN